MARKILIGIADRARTGTFYGGSWEALLPLSNLKDPRPQWVAQAASLTATFDIDFGVSATVDVFTLLNLRVSNAATVRVRASTDISFATTVYDSGTVSAWPRDNLNALYLGDEFIALGRPRWFVTPAQITCRYVRGDIVEPGPGPIQLGCCCASAARSPSVNFMPGWEQTSIDESFVEKVPFGSTYVTRRGTRRRLSLGWQGLPYAEMFEGVGGAQINWMATVHGSWLPTVVVPFPDDVGNLSRTAIYGLLRPDNRIRNSMFGRYEYLMQVEQLI